MPIKLFPKRDNRSEEEIRRRAERAEREYSKRAGEAPEEAGIEEGDITDYLFPVKGLGKKGIRAALRQTGAKAGRSGLRQKLEKPKKEPPTLDYSPGKMTSKPERERLQKLERMRQQQKESGQQELKYPSRSEQIQQRREEIGKSGTLKYKKKKDRAGTDVEFFGE